MQICRGLSRITDICGIFTIFETSKAALSEGNIIHKLINLTKYAESIRRSVVGSIIEEIFVSNVRRLTLVATSLAVSQPTNLLTIRKF